MTLTRELKLRTHASGWLDSKLRVFFSALARLISQSKLTIFLFLFGPIAITIAFLPSVFNIEMESNLEYLYTPTNGLARGERDLMKKLFTFDQENGFYGSRKTTIEGQLKVIIATKDESNIITQSHFSNILKLDNFTQSEAVLYDENSWTYSDLCGRNPSGCVQNSVLQLFQYNSSHVGTFAITFPVYGALFIGASFGGAELNANNELVSAKAVRLVYDVRTDVQVEEGLAWENGIMQQLLKYDLPLLNVYVESTLSREEALDEASDDVTTYFIITYVILVLFVIITCSSTDWVISKPNAAFAGLLSAVLSVGSAFGILLLCGLEFTSQVAVMPFLIIGVGVDDVFVIIESWRRTCGAYDEGDIWKNVQHRMADTFADASLTITITSLTNVLVFLIGASSVFNSVRIFSIYCGVGILFCYVYVITFFAAVMALDGLREETNRHCLAVCVEVKKPDECKDNKFYKVFLSGKKPPSKIDLTKSESETRLSSIFFKKHLSKIPNSNIGRIIIFILYGFYLAFAILGCLNLKQGLELKHLAVQDSYIVKFTEMSDIFDKYMISVSYIIPKELDYFDTDVTNKLEKFVQAVENSTYMTPDGTEFWLRDYLSFVSSYPPALQPQTKASHISFLKSQFLTHPAFHRYTYDINFEDDTITSSRFLVLSKFVPFDAQGPFTQDVRKVATDSEFDGVRVYSPIFIYFDQYIVIAENTLINLAISMACMFAVAVIFIPGYTGALWVTLSVASIEVGVVGYLHWWGVRLNSVSMITIILCMGFSVDFSSHITYHYMSSSQGSAKKNVEQCLRDMGLPIVQGAFSSIFGVVALFWTNSVMFWTFPKTILLVMFFGALHALFVLPVVFSFLPDNSVTPKPENEETTT